MANLLSAIQAVLWSAFFLVPTGRAQMADMLSADEVEQAFATLYRFSKELPFKVKTTEAQHYRRVHYPAAAQEQGPKPVHSRGRWMGENYSGDFSPSMTAKDLYLSHILARFARVASCPFPPAMCGWTA